MAGETTTPLLPCAAIDDMVPFYEALGFRVTYRQRRPNGYLVVVREDLTLHFFAMEGFAPADSYGSCLIGVPDAAALYAAFREGLRARYGAVPARGIPRLTRPRAKADGATGFAVIDPGGNWLRVHQHPRAADSTGEGEARAATRRSPLATATHAAALLGDSKGDHAGGAALLDKALARADAADGADLAAALAYRAELALALGDRPGAAAYLARLGALPLDAATRAAASADLDRADDLRRALAEAG